MKMVDIIGIILKTLMWVLIVGFGCNLVMQTISYSFYKNAKRFELTGFVPEHIQLTDTLSGYGHNLDADTDQVILFFGGSGYTAYNSVARFGDIFDCPFISADYYGSQASNGKMNIKSIQGTAIDLYDWAKETYPNKQIFVMGHSYGSGPATYLASQRGCMGLILMAAYRDLADLYNKMTPIFFGPAKVFISNDIRLAEYAQNVTCNTLLIGSNSDKTLDAKLQYKVAAYFANSQTVVFDDISHEDYLKDSRVVDLVDVLLR